MRKSAKIEIRMTPTEKAKWEAVAYASNYRSLSDFVRDTVEDRVQQANVPSAIKREEEETPLFGAEASLLDQPGPVVPVRRSAKQKCSRFYLHRPGVYCKECGQA